MKHMEKSSEKLHIVLEYFSFEMQFILDDFLEARTDFNGLLDAYNEIGTEGHDISVYKNLLEYAQSKGEKVKLHAGFLPKPFSRIVIK
jgi:uncharacterized iron-regulated protein